MSPAQMLRVQRLDPRAVLPTRAYAHDAGLDLHALEGVTLGPGDRASVRTGVAVEIPEGQAGLVLPRSGLAARHGIALVNAPGLIDAGYRGEVQVLLLNTDRQEACTLEAGDRIAQLVLITVATPAVLEVEQLTASERGQGGFGSSGGFGSGGFGSSGFGSGGFGSGNFGSSGLDSSGGSTDRGPASGR